MTNGRVLVTGGCGFVGSRLCAQLVNRGDEVIIIDNFSLGTPANLPPIIARDVDIVAADIRDTIAVRRCLEYYRPSTVYHLAALHFIPNCNADPKTCIGVNVEGTQGLLDACSAVSSVETIVLASSAAVYQPSDMAHTEESALGPIDIYGYTKLWAEQLVDLFHQKTGIGVGVARLFNVFGPGETNPHLIPIIIQQARQGNELHLGNLSTQRDYIFVDDVGSAIIKLADACCHSGLITCNVGSERQFDGNQLIEEIKELLNCELTLHVDPTRVRTSDRPYLLSDSRKACKLLGWKTETSLKEGLKAAFAQPLAAGIAF